MQQRPRDPESNPEQSAHGVCVPPTEPPSAPLSCFWLFVLIEGHPDLCPFKWEAPVIKRQQTMLCLQR